MSTQLNVLTITYQQTGIPSIDRLYADNRDLRARAAQLTIRLKQLRQHFRTRPPREARRALP